MFDRKDTQLLQELQNNFPIRPRPFAVIAKKYNISEESLCKKLKNWQRRKIIRYVGAIFDNRKLGIHSTLVAMKVPGRAVSRIARIINCYPQVSHNYLRDGEYNVWFTLSAPSRKKLTTLLKEIKKMTGIRQMLDLRTARVIKIDARFRLL